MLTSNDGLNPKQFVIDMANQRAFIGSCGTTISASALQRDEVGRRNVLVQAVFLIPPRTQMMAPTKALDLPIDRDFFFEPIAQANLVLYAHLVDHKMTSILIRDESNSPMQLSQKSNLGNVTLKSNTETVFRRLSSRVFAMTLPTKPPPGIYVATPSIPREIPETRLPNGVMVCGDAHSTKNLADLVTQFPDFWVDTDFVWDVNTVMH